MANQVRLACALVIVCLLAGCGPTPVVTRAPVRFEVAVSWAFDPLMNELIAAYRAQNPHVTFNVRRFDSAQAVDALYAGEVDLAAVSWLAEAEGVWVTAVAIDGVAVVVHPSNPVKALGVLQLRDVFRGRIADWQDVSGPAAEISVASLESGSGTRNKFEAEVMEGRHVTVNAVVLPSDQSMVDYVRTVTASIGYLSSGYLTEAVKAISVEGVPLTVETLVNRRYPFHRALIFVTPEEPQGDLRAFVAWALGAQGQSIVGQKYGRVK